MWGRCCGGKRRSITRILESRGERVEVIETRSGSSLCSETGVTRIEGNRMTTYESYLNSEWASSLDSLEGVPDMFEPRVRPSERGVFTQGAHDALNWIGAILPG